MNWCQIQVKWDSNDFGCQLIWGSIDLVVNGFELQMILVVCCFELQVMWFSIDLRLRRFGCQLVWDPNHLVVNTFELQMILVVCWFELQVMWLSIDLRFKCVGCQLTWDSNDLDVKWFESTDVWFKWFCQTKLFCGTSFKNEALKIKNQAFLRDFLQKWSFEDQKPSISARLPSKMKLWSSKTKLFCETSFKNVALQLKNEAFLRDFLQNWSFQDEKRSFSARLPSKLKLWRSKTKHLRDFLQNWHVEQTLDLRIPIRFSHFQVDASKVLRLPRKSWAEAYEVL